MSTPTTTTYKHFYDISKLIIWADGEGYNDDQAKRPRLILSFRDGNPRFIVYTGQPAPTGMITFPMDHYIFQGVLEMFKEVADGEPGIKRSIESIGNVWKDNKPTNEKRVVSTLHLGKTKEGIVYMSVISEDRPKIIFPLVPTVYHKYRDDTKEEIKKENVSVSLAKGLINILGSVAAQMIVKYTHDEYSSGERYPGAIVSPGNAPKSKKKEVPDQLSSDVLDDLDI